MRIIFTRHGESTANTQNIISNRGLLHGLTQNGRKQAASLVDKLQNYPITRIYSSPILRAIETSIILGYHLGVEYEVQEALREFDAGSLEGRADEDAWNIMKGTFESWMKGEQRGEPLASGESFVDVHHRFVPFIESLIEDYKTKEANLVCVAHGGIYWMMLPLLIMDLDIQTIFEDNGFDYATMIVSEWEEGGLSFCEWI